jgi:hypothetical protein
VEQVAAADAAHEAERSLHRQDLAGQAGKVPRWRSPIELESLEPSTCESTKAIVLQRAQ